MNSLSPAATGRGEFYEAPARQRLAHTLAHAAELLDYSIPSLYRLRKSGKIRFIQIGGRSLIPDSEVQRLAAEGTSEP